MAITQTTTVTIDGVVIGLSDTIGDLIQRGDFTPENLAPYMFCGNNTIGTTRYGSLTGAMKSYSGSAASQGLWFPVVCTAKMGNATVEYALNDNIALDNPCYGRNILVYGESPTSEIHSGHTESEQRVVTSIDFTKLYYDVELSSDTISSTRPTVETKTFYKSGASGKVKTITNNLDTNIYVYDIFVDNSLNEWYCIIDYHFPASDTANHQWKMCPTQKIDGNYGAITSNLYDGWSSFALTRAQWRWGSPSAYTVYGGENQSWAEGQNFDAFVNLGDDTVSHCDYDPYRAYCTCYVCGLDNALKQVSNAGLKFKYNNTWYKPLGQGGVIYGYTDDMTKTTEWDEITNVTGNTVPLTPPTPPTPDAADNEIDVNMQQFAPTQCFVNYIELSTENMIKLASGFNAYNASIWNIGGDLMKNLVSYKIFAVYGNHSGTIKNVSIGGHEIEYNSAPVSGNYIDDMGTVNLGSIEIGSKFRFNDWRDYAPYTKIECFVPCCGWCQLPPWCMGRTVTGTLYIDIANGSCKAVIKAGRTPVAEIGGCVAMDVPFSSVATGAKAAGIITAITNGAVSAFNPTPQNLISGSFGILSSLNANYTETKGVMGDGSNINGCTNFLVKVTRPASTDTGNGEITGTYKHEKGLPCGKTLKLSKGDGFTQISDANVTGTMTAREKQMIVDGFRHGLIL